MANSANPWGQADTIPRCRTLLLLLLRACDRQSRPVPSSPVQSRPLTTVAWASSYRITREPHPSGLHSLFAGGLPSGVPARVSAYSGSISCLGALPPKHPISCRRGGGGGGWPWAGSPHPGVPWDTAGLQAEVPSGLSPLPSPVPTTISFPGPSTALPTLPPSPSTWAPRVAPNVIPFPACPCTSQGQGPWLRHPHASSSFRGPAMPGAHLPHGTPASPGRVSPAGPIVLRLWGGCWPPLPVGRACKEGTVHSPGALSDPPSGSLPR